MLMGIAMDDGTSARKLRDERIAAGMDPEEAQKIYERHMQGIQKAKADFLTMQSRSAASRNSTMIRDLWEKIFAARNRLNTPLKRIGVICLVGGAALFCFHQLERRTILLWTGRDCRHWNTPLDCRGFACDGSSRAPDSLGKNREMKKPI